MSRRTRLYLQDIQTSCQKILRYTESMSFANFQADDRTFDAVVYNLQIIGEAVKNLPLPVREQAPEIEWRKIAGLRDILAHTYFQIGNYLGCCANQTSGSASSSRKASEDGPE